MLGASGHTPSNEIRPCVVFRPHTPQHAAGIRTEPPVSHPNATSASPVATATADPLEEPPGISPGSSGLTGVPNHGLVPSGSIASSSRFAFPTNRASAARQPASHTASRSAASAAEAMARQPAVVGTPATSMMSFPATRGPLPRGSNLVMKVATPRNVTGAAVLRGKDRDALITRRRSQSASGPTNPAARCCTSPAAPPAHAVHRQARRTGQSLLATSPPHRRTGVYAAHAREQWEHSGVAGDAEDAAPPCVPAACSWSTT